MPAFWHLIFRPLQKRQAIIGSNAFVLDSPEVERGRGGGGDSVGALGDGGASGPLCGDKEEGLRASANA